jgi:hypothetical protein
MTFVIDQGEPQIPEERDRGRSPMPHA